VSGWCHLVLVIPSISAHVLLYLMSVYLSLIYSQIWRVPALSKKSILAFFIINVALVSVTLGGSILQRKVNKLLGIAWEQV